MKIDDIPLPPSLPGKSARNDENNNFNVSNSNNMNSHALPLKRIINHKLPVGLIQKKDCIRINDSVNQRKELFLPSIHDKIQIAINNLRSSERESVADLIERPMTDRKNTIKPNIDSKINTNSRRKNNDYEANCVVKRPRVDEHSKDRWDENSVARVKSQVFVLGRDHSDRMMNSRYEKIHDQSYSRERWNHGHDSPRNRRSSIRKRDRYSSNKDHRLTIQNGYHRRHYIDVSPSQKRADPHIYSITNKHSCSPSSKKSLFATSTSHTNSASLISTCNMDLPLDSPKSPDDSPQHCTKVDPKVAATTANLCLKNLKDTLEKINVAYKSVFSKIPEPKIRQEEDICNIPLPSSTPDEGRPNGNHVHQTKTEHLTEPCHTKRRIHPNSINADKLSLVSSGTMDSVGPRSPLFSVNISSYSKESENSETRFKPAIPRISCFHVDYSQVETCLPKIALKATLSNTVKCHCTMPNPDQWNEDGIRACGRGQGCLMSQLMVECNSNRCPNEVLCCNRQFQELDSSGGHCNDAEFFFDINQIWKLRAKKQIQKHRLVFEVAGRAVVSPQMSEVQSHIRIAKDVVLSLKSDQHTFIYYLKLGSREEANVIIEKWLVNGHVRLGVFALCDIAPKSELIMFYSPDVLSESQSLDNESGLLSMIRSLVQDSPDQHGLVALLDQLLSPCNPAWVLDRFLELGGLALLCSSVLRLTLDDGVLLAKLADVLAVTPFVKASAANILGVDLRDVVATVATRGQFCARLDQTMTKLDQLLKKDCCPTKVGTRHMSSQCTSLYTLNCRLPTYWCSRECMSKAEARVFFYHRVTKAVQWDMPVYPWESNEDDDADIFDYDHASVTPVTHYEISQMYLNLNKMYEIKQRKILYKETNPRHSKQFSDAYKKEAFRKKMMEFILRLLRPYRDVACRVGRITSDEDMRYLANKLTQTILFKELKILNNATELLQVTGVVENKTKTYVETYLQSRGSTYTRPSNPPEITRKQAT